MTDTNVVPLAIRFTAPDYRFPFKASDLSAEMVQALAAHGFKQKVDDRMAGAVYDSVANVLVTNNKPMKGLYDAERLMASGEDVVSDMWRLLLSGRWAGQRGSTGPRKVLTPLESFVIAQAEAEARRHIANGAVKIGGETVRRATADNIKLVVKQLVGDSAWRAKTEKLYTPDMEAPAVEFSFDAPEPKVDAAPAEAEAKPARKARKAA